MHTSSLLAHRNTPYFSSHTELSIASNVQVPAAKGPEPEAPCPSPSPSPFPQCSDYFTPAPAVPAFCYDMLHNGRSFSC